MKPTDLVSTSDARGTPTHDGSEEPTVSAVDPLTRTPLEMRLRPEDVRLAYRAWYRSLIAKDYRTELGRFLFGVSSTTMAAILGASTLGAQSAGWQLNWPALGASMILLVVSAFVSLRLAIPSGRVLDPAEMELVRLHLDNVSQIRRISRWWMALWLAGLASGVAGLMPFL